MQAFHGGPEPRASRPHAQAHSLGLTAHDDELARAAADFVRRELTDQGLRQVLDNPFELPRCWSALADTGLMGAHLPEEFGGQGAGLRGLATVLEVIGRTATLGVFSSSALTSAVIAASNGDRRATLLPAFADGLMTGAVITDSRFTATGTETGAWVLTGESGPAVAATHADLLVVAVDFGDRERWIALDSARLHRRPADPGLDGAPKLYRFSANRITVGPTDVLPGVNRVLIESIATVVHAAEAVGICAWSTSVQTRPGPRLGRTLIGLHSARSAVWAAAHALDTGADGARATVALAGLVAPDSAVHAAGAALDDLGDNARAWDQHAHIHFRRAQLLRGLTGSSRAAAGLLARTVRTGGHHELDADFTGGHGSVHAEIRAELSRIAALPAPWARTALHEGGWVLPGLPAPLGRGSGWFEQLWIAQECDRLGIVLPDLGAGASILSVIAAHSTAPRIRAIMRSTLRGELRWCPLFDAPGGRATGPVTFSAAKVRGGWRVTGQKDWATTGFDAEWAALIACTGDDPASSPEWTYFVVDMSSPGVTIFPVAGSGSAICDVRLDDVFVPDSGRIGARGAGVSLAGATVDRLGAHPFAGRTRPSMRELLVFAGDRGAPSMESAGRWVADQLMRHTLVLYRALRWIPSGEAEMVTAAAAEYLAARAEQRFSQWCAAELVPLILAQPLLRETIPWVDAVLEDRRDRNGPNVSPDARLRFLAEWVLADSAAG